MGILTKEQIEAIDDMTSKTVEVEVPEWGGSVRLRPLTVTELDEYSNAIVRAKQNGLANFRSRLVAYCMCDKNGVRLFDEQHIEGIAKRNAVIVNRLYEACDRLNDISPRKVEEIAGNSEAGQSESSASGSPATLVEPSKS